MLPRTAVVVEDRYSQVFQLDRVRPARVADGSRWPGVPLAFSETRRLAEEWTYRYLAAAHAWAHTCRCSRYVAHGSIWSNYLAQIWPPKTVVDSRVSTLNALSPAAGSAK